MTSNSMRGLFVTFPLTGARFVFTFMPSRCCVAKCRSDYDSDIKATGKTYPVFSFPAENDPERNREEWYQSLPNVLTDTGGKKTCIRHWSEKIKIDKNNRKKRKALRYR